ncbi:MAG: HIT domain-containing protein [archaeon]
MLSPEQTEKIKQQLIQQIGNLPQDKQSAAKSQILSMNSEQLEDFLEKNNMIQQGDGQGQQCIFCSIVAGEIPSYKIGENKEAVAVLELNPISKGHSLIIPKIHEEQMQIPKEIPELVQEITEKIKTVLKPKDVKASTSKLFNHEVINLVPVYKDETLDSERHKADKKELEETQKILADVKVKKKKTPSKKPRIKKINADKNKIWLPKRIP